MPSQSIDLFEFLIQTNTDLPNDLQSMALEIYAQEQKLHSLVKEDVTKGFFSLLEQSQQLPLDIKAMAKDIWNEHKIFHSMTVQILTEEFVTPKNNQSV